MKQNAGEEAKTCMHEQENPQKKKKTQYQPKKKKGYTQKVEAGTSNLGGTERQCPDMQGWAHESQKPTQS